MKKMLKPGPSERLPAESQRIAVSAPASSASSWARVVILEARLHRRAGDARRLGHEQAGADLLLLARDQPHVGNGEREEVRLELAEVMALVRSPCERHVDVGVLETAAVDASGEDPLDALCVVGALHAEAGGRRPEALHVVVEAEEEPLPRGDDVVDDVAPKEAGIENRDLRIAETHVLAFDERDGLG